MAVEESTVKKVVSLNRMGRYLVLRIPKEIEKALCLKHKDKVIVELKREKIVIKKIE